MYSFRPEDADKTWPQIAITPSSFQAISSMKTMLNMVPYIVVKEYFFKNTASTVISFVKKIFQLVKDSSKSPTKNDEDQESAGSEGAKSSGSSWLDKVAEKFIDISPEEMIIDIPYALYCGLRTKVYGNTYVFPYLATPSTVINQASNDAEWGNGDAGSGPLAALKKMAGAALSVVGGMAMNLLGS